MTPASATVHLEVCDGSPVSPLWLSLLLHNSVSILLCWPSLMGAKRLSELPALNARHSDPERRGWFTSRPVSMKEKPPHLLLTDHPVHCLLQYQWQGQGYGYFIVDLLWTTKNGSSYTSIIGTITKRTWNSRKESLIEFTSKTTFKETLLITNSVPSTDEGYSHFLFILWVWYMLPQESVHFFLEKLLIVKSVAIYLSLSFKYLPYL